MNANEEPRNAGTFPFARKWNSSVPRPANRSVADTDRPVSAGTSTVAPNMANICCRPNTPIFGTPSGRASYTASGLSLAPMVGAGRSLLVGETPVASLSPRAAPPPDGERASKTFGLLYATRKARGPAETSESALLSRREGCVAARRRLGQGAWRLPSDRRPGAPRPSTRNRRPGSGLVSTEPPAPATSAVAAAALHPLSRSCLHRAARLHRLARCRSTASIARRRAR